MNITSACKLFFTDACILQLKKISYEREESVVLRIRVISGGCAGLQYTLSLEPSLHLDSDSDIAFTKDGVIAVADDISIKYIAGSTIDYQETLMMSQFVVINPNSDEHCSCGSSFQMKPR